MLGFGQRFLVIYRVKNGFRVVSLAGFRFEAGRSHYETSTKSVR